MGASRQPDECDAEAAGSLRRCIVTRAERPPADLIRFVAGPDGVIVPDLACRLPGRGVWVTAERAAVEAAAKAGAFARSLKRSVTVPEDLSANVEALLIRRTLEALSLANKAGAASTGFEKVEKLLGSGRAAVLVHGADAAEGGRGKLDRKFAAIQQDSCGKPPIVDWLTIAQMSLAMGRPNVVHAALIQGGATKRFLSEAERLRRYRSGFGAS